MIFYLTKASTSWWIKKVTSTSSRQIWPDQPFLPAFSIDRRICQSFMHHLNTDRTGYACMLDLKDEDFKRLEASFFFLLSNPLLNWLSMHTQALWTICCEDNNRSTKNFDSSSFIRFHLPWSRHIWHVWGTKWSALEVFSPLSSAKYYIPCHIPILHNTVP